MLSNPVATRSETLVRQRQEVVAAIIYYVLGWCCGIGLLQHRRVCCGSIEHAASWLNSQAIQQLLEWLMGAPAGTRLL